MPIGNLAKVAASAAKPPLLFLSLIATVLNPQLKQTLSVRLAQREDIPNIASVNLKTLPENYNHQFYVQHLLNWPQLALVAECTGAGPAGGEDTSMESAGFEAGAASLRGRAASQPRVVGYVLGRMSNPPPAPGSVMAASDVHLSRQGHITSLAVLPGWRRQGVAVELMAQVHEQMVAAHDAERVSLHVRASNRGALRLYGDGLGYRVEETIPSYYADGEDALLMRASLGVGAAAASPQDPDSPELAQDLAAAAAAAAANPGGRLGSPLSDGSSRVLRQARQSSDESAAA